MSTLDSTFLIIGSVCISLFFITGIVLTVSTWILLRRIMKKAEAAIESVESVANAIREVGTKGSSASLVKLLKFIFKMGKRS